MADDEKRRVIDEDKALTINADDMIFIDSSANGSRAITYADLCSAVALTLGIAGIKSTADSAMQKSVYDSNSDGIVDNSAKLENHPASYFATAEALSDVKSTADSAMQKSAYDSDSDGIVDKAKDSETVNRHAVYKDVPADAVFTDTVYDDTEVQAAVKKAQETADAATKDIGLEVVDGKLCVVYDV